MGGKSSSSSATTKTTTQIDERIAATDNASVIDIGDKSTVTLTDQGAVESAGLLALETINQFGSITLAALGQGQAAVSALDNNNQNVLDFVDTQNRDENGRTLQEIVPWLIGGVSVLAITGAIKFK